MNIYTKEPLKYVATINDEALTEKTHPCQEILYVDIGNVDSTGIINEIAEYRFEDAPSRARRIVRNGDVIISTVRTYLQAVAPIESPPDNLIVSTGFAVVRPRLDKFDTGYCKYALCSSEFVSEVVSRSVGISYPAINSSDLSDINVYVPTVSQQQQIANYLDRKTEKIDALIAAKKRLLELLSEKRRSMITHAVTRGLRDDVPMKYSSVEWIGEIPEDWRLVKIKHVATIGNGSTPLRDELPYWQDGLFPWLTSTVANDDVIGDAEEFVTAVALKECHLPIVRPNSILVAITGQGKTRGKAALLPYQATINQHLAFITPLDKFLETEFLRLFLTSAYNVLRMISEGMGSTKGALTCEQLGDFIIPLPSLAEQQKIVNDLQNTTQHIDLLSGITTEAIALLQERRTSLISAAVTGQIRIPD